ncbi:hypothetical protein ABZU76_27240 [Amycolatopsis sp. NPDC005232]|uniref:hypothetical protein n=1 Tax=Amycolatopsis sp. NPDC005232 TaxID=3157027 RepID=UPI0033AD4152
MNVLRLVPSVRPGEVFPTGGIRTHREYLDFEIDGARLGESLRSLGDDVIAVAPADLGADALPDGRVPLFVCPECGDLGCGGVTVVLERTADEVVWRDFGWQTDYDPEVFRERYAGLGPFRFSRAQYDAMLS